MASAVGANFALHRNQEIIFINQTSILRERFFKCQRTWWIRHNYELRHTQERKWNN